MFLFNFLYNIKPGAIENESTSNRLNNTSSNDICAAMTVEEKLDEANMDDLAEYEDHVWINTKSNARVQELSVENFMNLSIEKVYLEFGDAVVEELIQVQYIIRSHEDQRDCEYKGCVQCDEQICTKFEFGPGRVDMIILVTGNMVYFKMKRKRHGLNKTAITLTAALTTVVGGLWYFSHGRSNKS